jgi:hypothetical protein
MEKDFNKYFDIELEQEPEQKSNNIQELFEQAKEELEQEESENVAK